jgi:TonB family protein
MKNQYRHIKNVPSISNDDIANYKNFKNILDRRTEEIQKNLETRKLFLKVGISFAIISAISLGLLYWKGGPTEKGVINSVDIKSTENAIPIRENQKLEIPTANVKREGIKKAKEIRVTKSKPSSTHKNKETDLDKNLPEVSDQQKFQIGYEKAFPIVGMDSLSNYFNEKLRYPEKVDKTQGIEGSVTVIFTITKGGDASKMEVQNSLGEAFDEECFRLISNMPRWKPAVRNGKKVESKVSLQLSFNLEK